jgi:cAMP phosphodiesterase
VRSTATQWSKNSVLAVDAGSHLAPITRLLEEYFPLVSDPPRNSAHLQNGTGRSRLDRDSTSPGTSQVTLGDESGSETPASEDDLPVTITTLLDGVFAGLPFPHASARANALHLVREHISTYLITHPHLDHVSGFVINTAAFHNTSRPKRLAALPHTVNAIKAHIFNNIIWPNLTDEDGGVGLVSFQRLAEGGNIALGQGSGRGYLEVCDGLGVKGFKVSHGHCMNGTGHVHRGSAANVQETGLQQAAAAHPNEGHDTHPFSFSLPAPSIPGTPSHNGPEQGRRPSGGTSSGMSLSDHCVIDSTAYFIRAESTLTTPTREILIFGDVEPDSLSLSPRTSLIWAEAAPKIAAGTLTGIFIECSYTDAQADAVLFGHLAPRHLLSELSTLADLVADARREQARSKELSRRGRKRKRASNSLHLEPPNKARTWHGDSVIKGVDTPLAPTHNFAPTPPTNPNTAAAAPAEDDDPLTLSAFASRATTGTHTPTYPVHASHAALNAALNLPSAPPDADTNHAHNRAFAAAFEPLRGLRVVIIHVKDTCEDGPPVGQRVLKELQDGAEKLAGEGKALGCGFVVCESGDGFWF